MLMGQGQGADEGPVLRGQRLGAAVDGPMSSVQYQVAHVLGPRSRGQGLGAEAKCVEVKGPRSSGPRLMGQEGANILGARTRGSGQRAKVVGQRSRGQGRGA